MELFADGLGERAGNVAVVEIQNVNGKQNHGGEQEAIALAFLSHGACYHGERV